MEDLKQLRLIHTLSLIIIITFCTQFPLANGIQCTDMAHPKIHYFMDFTDYTTSPIGFDAKDAATQGNFVSFTGKAVPTGILRVNSFVRNTSEYIRQVDLYKQGIRVIMPGAFNSLFCLKSLDLSANNLTKIDAKMFTNLTHNLEELNLSFNQILIVTNASFASLTSLRKLDLSNNSLKVLPAFSFFNNTLLVELYLQNNFLHKLDAGAMSDVPHLQVIRLDGNKLDYLNVTNWTNATHLTKLNISSNFLHIFDVGTNASLPKLTDLDLSGNMLTKLNVSQVMTKLPQLTRMFLDGNPWFCDYLDGMMGLMGPKVDVLGYNSSAPLHNGIACIERFTTPSPSTTTAEQSSEVAPSLASSSPTAQTAPETTTTETNHTTDKYAATTLTLVNSIESLQATVTLLTIIVIALVIVEVVMRSGVYRKFFKRRAPGPLFDVNRTYNSEPENISLLRS